MAYMYVTLLYALLQRSGELLHATPLAACAVGVLEGATMAGAVVVVEGLRPSNTGSWSWGYAEAPRPEARADTKRETRENSILRDCGLRQHVCVVYSLRMCCIYTTCVYCFTFKAGTERQEEGPASFHIPQCYVRGNEKTAQRIPVDGGTTNGEVVHLGKIYISSARLFRLIILGAAATRCSTAVAGWGL